MIQFNLLPDVKLDYLKTKRTKQKAIFISALATGGALFVLLILFLVVNVAQKQHLSNLNKDITRYSQQLKNTKDLNKILTIQNQLKSLPALHDQKVVSSRVFNYLSQLIPIKSTISSFNIDFASNQIVIKGTADTLTTVNQLADTLKFTTFKTDNNSASGTAFSNVVLTSFTKDSSTTTYEITVTFNPAIFSSDGNVTLSVPHIISTRSETEKPSELFQPSNDTTNPPNQ